MPSTALRFLSKIPSSLKKWQRGYTLIEILVVLFIICTIASFILLKPNANHANRQLINSAKQLMAMMQLAQEQATLQQSILGLQLHEDNYEFLQLNANNWISLAAQDRFWQTQTFNNKIQITVDANNADSQPVVEKLPNQPSIIFFPGGEVTPFIITISYQNSSTQVQIVGSSAGEIALLPKESQP